MTLAFFALVVAAAASAMPGVNAGLPALALAWIVGGERAVELFPSGLFLTLLGTTLLFSCAKANGTVDRLAQVATVTRSGGLAALSFLLPLVLAALGAGNISAVALLAPVLLSAAARTGAPLFPVAALMIAGAKRRNILSAGFHRHRGSGDLSWHRVVSQSMDGYLFAELDRADDVSGADLLGGGDASALVSAVNVGSHLVAALSARVRLASLLGDRS